MHERPIGDLVDTLRALGCGVECLEKEGYPPLRVSAGPGPLSFDAPAQVRGDVSSQFLSALLLALPLRAEPVDAVIEVEGELISKPYVEITLKLLEAFGIARRARGHAALSPGRRPAAALAGPLRRRGRRVVGVVLHRRGGDRRGRRAAAHRGRRQRLDPGRHRLRRRGRGRWARASSRAAAGWRCAAAAGRSPRSTSTATPCPTRR